MESNTLEKIEDGEIGSSEDFLVPCVRCKGTGKITIPLQEDLFYNQQKTRICPKCHGYKKLTWIENIMGKKLTSGTSGMSGSSGARGTSWSSGSSGNLGTSNSINYRSTIKVTDEMIYSPIKSKFTKLKNLLKIYIFGDS